LRHSNLSLEVYGDVIIEEQSVSTIPNLFSIFLEIFFTLLNPLYPIKQNAHTTINATSVVNQMRHHTA
jgi:hypothetical protein